MIKATIKYKCQVTLIFADSHVMSLSFSITLLSINWDNTALTFRPKGEEFQPTVQQYSYKECLSQLSIIN